MIKVRLSELEKSCGERSCRCCLAWAWFSMQRPGQSLPTRTQRSKALRSGVLLSLTNPQNIDVLGRPWAAPWVPWACNSQQRSITHRSLVASCSHPSYGPSCLRRWSLECWVASGCVGPESLIARAPSRSWRWPWHHCASCGSHFVRMLLLRHPMRFRRSPDERWRRRANCHCVAEARGSAPDIGGFGTPQNPSCAFHESRSRPSGQTLSRLGGFNGMVLHCGSSLSWSLHAATNAKSWLLAASQRVGRMRGSSDGAVPIAATGLAIREYRWRLHAHARDRCVVLEHPTATQNTSLRRGARG